MADAGASTSRNLDDVLKKLQKNSYYNTKRQIKFDKQRSFDPSNSTDIDDNVACPIKETEKSKLDTTGELIDSYLGTIIGENDEIINNLADQLASSLNMPYVFMSIEEYNKLRESEMIQGPIKEENTEYILYDDRDSNGLTGDESGSIPNDIRQDYVTVKGDMLIKLLIGDCCETYKNAVDRIDNGELENVLRTKLKMPNKPVSYYITKRKYRKLHLNDKFKRFKLNNNDLSNILFSIKNKTAELSTYQHDSATSVISQQSSTSKASYDDENIIMDLAIYKAFLYTNAPLNTIHIENGVKFILPIFNESKMFLNIFIGSGINQTNLYVYDALLRNRRSIIDLKSEIRNGIYRYHNLYFALNSGEIAVLSKNLNSVEKIIKITDKKISYLSFAFHNKNKLLLVGSYDGKIHMVPVKPYGTHGRNYILSGHETAPLSIKTRRLLSRVLLSDTITSLAIHDNILVSCGFDGLIKCFAITFSFDPTQKNENLNLVQQYYGHDPTARLMCLKTEGNTIFYGDDRGNIESLELNTSKTFVCKFPNCNKPFATTHYLLKHLFAYHFNLMKHQVNTRFKCEWSGCDKWYDSNQLKAHIIGHFEFI